jgi:hypothetical protein
MPDRITYRRRGPFSRVEETIYWSAIEAVTIRQSLLGALFQYGDIIIVAGESERRWRMPNPQAWLQSITSHVSTETETIARSSE